MTDIVTVIRDLTRVLAFYSRRLELLRPLADNEIADEPLTRGYLSGDSAEMAYRSIAPWYSLVEPLYAEIEASMQKASFEEKTAVLSDPEILELLPANHRIRAAYELDKEVQEAEHMLDETDPQKALSDIIEHQSYWILTEPVLEALSGAKRVAVIGSGPLPLTAIAVAERTNAEVTCYERDTVAYDLGDKIIELSKARDKITSLCESAVPGPDMAGFDAILCAVLLGVSVEDEHHHTKKELLTGFAQAMGSNGKVILRDPYQLGALFYPKAGIEEELSLQSRRFDPDMKPGDPYRSSFLILNAK